MAAAGALLPVLQWLQDWGGAVPIVLVLLFLLPMVLFIVQVLGLVLRLGCLL
jgi:hypothetical protein